MFFPPHAAGFYQLGQHAADQCLRVAIAIIGAGIDQIDSGKQRLAKALPVVGDIRRDAVTSKTRLTGHQAGFSKVSINHRRLRVRQHSGCLRRGVSINHVPLPPYIRW